MEQPRPDELAADGVDVPAGVTPPTVDEQLEYLAEHGWTDAQH